MWGWLGAFGGHFSCDWWDFSHRTRASLDMETSSYNSGQTNLLLKYYCKSCEGFCFNSKQSKRCHSFYIYHLIITGSSRICKVSKRKTKCKMGHGEYILSNLSLSCGVLMIRMSNFRAKIQSLSRPQQPFKTQHMEEKARPWATMFYLERQTIVRHVWICWTVMQ